MSAPFAGAPAPGPAPARVFDIHADLARLTPPRKLYQWYYSTPSADADPVALIPAVTAVCRSISRAMRRD